MKPMLVTWQQRIAELGHRRGEILGETMRLHGGTVAADGSDKGQAFQITGAGEILAVDSAGDDVLIGYRDLILNQTKLVRLVGGTGAPVDTGTDLEHNNALVLSADGSNAVTWQPTQPISPVPWSPLALSSSSSA